MIVRHLCQFKFGRYALRGTYIETPVHDRRLTNENSACSFDHLNGHELVDVTTKR